MKKQAQSSIIRLLIALILSVIVVGLLIFSFMIGIQHYQQTTTDLETKANSVAGIAAVALAEPIWNFDEQAIAGVINAILLDEDVVGIEVISAETGKTTAKDFKDSLKNLEYADIVAQKDTLNLLINTANVERENAAIGEVRILTSRAKVQKQIKETSILIGAFAVTLILIMGLMVWVSARKLVAAPLKRLETSADQLARGNLDYPIDTGRNDEIGALATSFSEMRNAIRKKIEDLHVINTTGETLAGIHDQTLALETVLKVINEHTRLQFGSIYLAKGNTLEISAFFPEGMQETIGTQHTPRDFQFGEGVAGKVAQSGKTLFVSDTSKAADFVATASSEPPKALLCVPMMDNNGVFGVMNFSGDVAAAQFKPEDEEFALTLARLTVVTIKNIQMLKVIEEQNRTLEQKVLDRTAQLRQKTNDINSMLQNMQQGIFTITQDGTVHPEYSSYLERILDIRPIAGAHFMKVLFEGARLGADQINQVENAVLAMLGEDPMMYEFNSHLLVNEFCLGNKILDLDWAVIIDDGCIQKIMVTVRDVTELRALQIEAENQRQELEIIGQILAINQRKFDEFIKSSESFIEQNENLIQGTEQYNVDVLATLFRNMHTIKGNARTYGFRYLTDAVHEAENTYDTLRRKQEAEWDKDALLNELHKAGDCVAKYKQVYETKLSKFADATQGKFIEKTLFDSILATTTHAVTHHEQAVAAIVHVNTLLQAVDAEPVANILDGIVKALPALADELGKAAPQVHLDTDNLRVHGPLAAAMKDVFMHMFRNAMDHGIEAPAERERAGKPHYGTISLQASLSGDKLVIQFKDDGRGLALGRIRQKALENGLINDTAALDDATAAELIFNSGLSTAQAVSNISGRGVGMDAVRQFLRAHDGDIHVRFTDTQSKGQDFRPFALEIQLPGHAFIKVSPAMPMAA